MVEGRILRQASRPVLPFDELILWKAPQRGRAAEREVVDGYDPAVYPGNGPYFTTKRTVAEDFQDSYANGMQQIHIPGDVFRELIDHGIIVPDPMYDQGVSYHVPSVGLAVFNAAMQRGTPNVYTPEET
jgi:hypothetical protein